MYANFDMEEIVAFGDDYNDIEMLRACGTGVAVGNALAEVKQAADEVCLTNEEDGVALWLTEHVLREDWVRKNLYH
ncbi:MAG: HAD hydrolase family protein [Lachnospiraceae bacterium]|nr:HAD hydrolase family protein [Lachnospiraceae bacterium]